MGRGFALYEDLKLGQKLNVLIRDSEPSEFVREESLLAAQVFLLLKKTFLAAPKEEESSHPLLRGAGNTAEGFEVHRANILQVLHP